jgi:histidine phosphotransferase ChpT
LALYVRSIDLTTSFGRPTRLVCHVRYPPYAIGDQSVKVDRPGSTDTAAVRLAIAELAVTRMCHDMAGLCSTLTNSLELASEDHGTTEEALELAQDAARELADRLRVMRAAWGQPGEPLDRSRLEAMAVGLPGVRRLKLNLNGLGGAPALSSSLGRLLLNALILGAEALPAGGTLTATGDATGLEVAIKGTRAAWPEGLTKLLADPSRAADAAVAAGPRALQGPLLVLMAQASRVRLRLRQADLPDAAPVLRIETA